MSGPLLPLGQHEIQEWLFELTAGVAWRLDESLVILFGAQDQKLKQKGIFRPSLEIKETVKEFRAQS